MLSSPQNYSTNITAKKLVSDRLLALGYGTNVKKFQSDNHLIADGIVGPLTWMRLFSDRPEVAPTSKVLRDRAIQIARTQLYVREKTGHNDGKEVKQYLNSIGLNEGYAWCAAFVYWCFDKSAKDLGVINPVPKTGGVLNHWDITHGTKLHAVDANAGDIFIMDFGGGYGHTGIISQVRWDKVYTIEGNTSADPTLPTQDREGNGVYERVRMIKSIKGVIRY